MPRPSPRPTLNLSSQCSLYLLSAVLVLLGGYLNLHDAHGRSTTVAMVDVFGTHLAYQAALILAIAFLHRVRGEVRDTVTLLAVLGVFLVDGLLVQHVYGWEPGPGLLAAALGSGAAVASLALLAWILRISPFQRLFATIVGTVFFVRFAPALLVSASSDEEVSKPFVLLGFALATLPLCVFLPPLARFRSRLPLAGIETAGIAGALAVAVLHFVSVGASFDLGFRLVYLAPFVILLAPALEHLAPSLALSPVSRRAVGALPYVGLALSASSFPPGLLEAHWAQAWPLTPFCLSLVLTAVVQICRGAGKNDPALGHAGAFLLVLGCLGGDLPEILTAARFPQLWQVLLVNVAVWSVVWSTATRQRGLQLGTWLAAAAAFVSASFVAERGYPWTIAFLLLLGWSGLLLSALTRRVMPPPVRLAVGVLLTLVPVLTLLLEHDSRPRLVVAAAALAVAGLHGWARRDGVLLRLTPLAAGIGLLVYPLVLENHLRSSPGRLVTELGFAVLALAFLRSVYGGRIQEQWRILLPRGFEGARVARAPEVRS